MESQKTKIYFKDENVSSIGHEFSYIIGCQSSPFVCKIIKCNRSADRSIANAILEIDRTSTSLNRSISYSIRWSFDYDQSRKVGSLWTLASVNSMPCQPSLSPTQPQIIPTSHLSSSIDILHRSLHRASTHPPRLFLSVFFVANLLFLIILTHLIAGGNFRKNHRAKSGNSKMALHSKTIQ